MNARLLPPTVNRGVPTVHGSMQLLGITETFVDMNKKIEDLTASLYTFGVAVERAARDR